MQQDDDYSEEQYHFMGSMLHKEFIREFERMYGGQPGHSKAKKRTKARENWSAPAADPVETVHIDKLQWNPIYTAKDVRYFVDYQSNAFTVKVLHYHEETYPLTDILRDWVSFLRGLGIDHYTIMHGPVATGKDYTAIWEWLVHTGQFPMPMEETIGVRPGFIDMKQLIT